MISRRNNGSARGRCAALPAPPPAQRAAGPNPLPAGLTCSTSRLNWASGGLGSGRPGGPTAICPLLLAAASSLLLGLSLWGAAGGAPTSWREWGGGSACCPRALHTTSRTGTWFGSLAQLRGPALTLSPPPCQHVWSALGPFPDLSPGHHAHGSSSMCPQHGDTQHGAPESPHGGWKGTKRPKETPAPVEGRNIASPWGPVLTKHTVKAPALPGAMAKVSQHEGLAPLQARPWDQLHRAGGSAATRSSFPAWRLGSTAPRDSATPNPVTAEPGHSGEHQASPG